MRILQPREQPDRFGQRGQLIAEEVETLQLHELPDRIRQRSHLKAAEIKFGGARLGRGSDVAHCLTRASPRATASALPRTAS